MASQLSIPILLPTSLSNITGEPNSDVDLVELACSRAKATSLLSWNLPFNSSRSEDSSSGRGLGGIAMGCEDGSLFVFRANSRPQHKPTSPSSPPTRNLRVSRLSSPPSSRASSPLGRSHSPSPSISGVAPFNLASRSRIVSGVTKEQAQAPTTYVDFDEEPDKLKSMLKSGGGVRERSMMDGIIPTFHQDLVIGSKKEKGEKSASTRPTLSPEDSGMSVPDITMEAKQTLSSVRSPTISFSNISPPSSPPVLSEQPGPSNVTLQYHVVFSETTNESAIRALSCLEDLNQLLVLQQHGRLLVCDLEDGSYITSLLCPGNRYDWRRLQVFRNDERILVLLGGRPLRRSPDQPPEESECEEIRFLLLEYSPKRVGDPCGQPPFSIIEQWPLRGPCALDADVRLMPDGNLSLLYMDEGKCVIVRTIMVSPKFLVPSKEIKRAESPGLLDRHLLKNPFKALTMRSHESLPLLNKSEVSIGEEAQRPQSHLGPVVELGQLPLDSCVLGLSLRRLPDSVCGFLAISNEALIFTHISEGLVTKKVTFQERIMRSQWLDDNTLAVYFSDRVDIVHFGFEDDEIRLDKQHTFISSPSQASVLLDSTKMLWTYMSSNGARIIIAQHMERDNQSQPKHQLLWQAAPSISSIHATAILPVEAESLVVGYEDGTLRQYAPFELGNSTATMTPQKTSNSALGGFVCFLDLVGDPVLGMPLIIGGADDGSVAFWSLRTLDLVARWTLFATPLVRTICTRVLLAGRFENCVLCISQDGSMAVVALGDLHFLFFVPGSESSLDKICIDEESMWLIYDDGLARHWDLKTREFRRSTTKDKAQELLKQSGWSIWEVRNTPRTDRSIERVTPAYASLDTASTVRLNFSTLLQTPPANPIKDAENIGPPVPMLIALRTVLSAMLTPGLNEEIDRICEKELGVRPAAMRAGIQRDQSSTILKAHNPRHLWSISSMATTTRLVGILIALKIWITLGHAPDSANTVLLFYSTSLAHTIGPSFRPPDIALLAQHWLESSSKPVLSVDRARSVDLMTISEDDIRQAIRVALDAEIARQPDEDIIKLVEEWQEQLPSHRNGANVHPSQTTTAIFICGHVAVAKFNLVSSNTLISLSKSITMYLHDDDLVNRALAIDLCARGFDIWQNHADAMDLLRALFSMAAIPNKKDMTAHNVGTQARSAVVLIATHNGPLFTTTLSMEISQPQSVEDRRSAMQILAFLVRKKPLVIYLSLPRLLEAVVKSLDPTLTSERDAVFDAATEILGHVVQRFPTVDFHAATQRLAVGTGEGAVIMYDVKTATRLYVLDGHKKRASGCSFSPDGRRLVTVSLEESAALVWKVGSSFSSFFYPGAPPRQGNSGSDPFKTFPFNVEFEGQLSLADTLDQIRFEWPTDKNVKLKIRSSTLTFSTQ